MGNFYPKVPCSSDPTISMMKGDCLHQWMCPPTNAKMSYAKKGTRYRSTRQTLSLVAYGGGSFVIVWSALSFLASLLVVQKELFARPFNPNFQGPSLFLGDRSDYYASLRQEVDAVLEKDGDQYLHQALSKNRKLNMIPGPTYDINNCPFEPPPNYPFGWPTSELLKAWPIQGTDLPNSIHQSLCVFDFQRDYNKAMHYRNASLPYVLINDPSVHKTVARWHVPDYLHRLVRGEHLVDYSPNHVLLFFQDPFNQPWYRRWFRSLPRNWQPPTTLLRMTFDEWFDHAQQTRHPSDPHWYLGMSSCGLVRPDGRCHEFAPVEYLYDELPFFVPTFVATANASATKSNQLYLYHENEQDGVYCRFGSPATTSVTHLDSGTNFVVMLGGKRRYILQSPDQCSKLNLLPAGHPSARHSTLNWSHPEELHHVSGSEIVLQPGQVLYLPTYWFHTIVSLDTSYQCNTRTASDIKDRAIVRDCGFWIQ